MASVCFYFQVHQPYRLKKYRIFDIGRDNVYFNDASGTNLDNKWIFQKVATKCYLPTNEVLLDLLNRHPEFKISFSLSGVFLEQAAEYMPQVLDSFKRLIDTGRVEILGETYYHSLAFLHSRTEWLRQIMLHTRQVKKLFGVEPTTFRNTELIYNNDIAHIIEGLGYQAILLEGADHILDWRSPNFLYRPRRGSKLKMLLKNYKLSDDVAFRFSSRDWNEWPLSAEKFAHWVSQVNGNGEVVNLFMDYETFGEHQWADTGIFDFLRHLPAELLKHPDNDFLTPTEAAGRFPARGVLDVPDYVSWADVERDLSAWRSNDMQYDALNKIYALEKDIISLGDKKLIDDWRRLQTSDHFYYMCTKWFNDGDVHKYFNPYESPYDAFITFMNVLNDLQLRLKQLKNNSVVTNEQ
ncbi:MAG: glycoside hydrolase family 57 protein [Candidatus Paceibacterota bacterium]